MVGWNRVSGGCLISFVRRDFLRMRSWSLFSLIALTATCLFAMSFPARSQAESRVPVFDATVLREPADLGGIWLVHGGDDPAYARADFDDSQWIPFDPRSSVIALFQRSRPDVVWYRLRVRVDPAQSGLALREVNLARAFEIYVNGERLFASGQVEPFVAYTPYARLLERIPDRVLATGTLSIALRVRISQSEWTNTQNPGFYIANLTLGQEGTLYRDGWLAVVGENAFRWLDRFWLIGLGLVALVLFTGQRRQTEYLWIFAMGALQLLETPFQLVPLFQNIPATWLILGAVFRVASPYIYVSLYFAFVHQRLGWRWRAFLAVTGLLNAANAMIDALGGLSLPAQFLTSFPFIVLISVVIPIVLALHWRRGNREAGILLIPVVLLSLYIYAEFALGTMFQFPAWKDTALRGLNLIDRFPAGPFSLSLDNVSGILSTISLSIILLLRATTTSRRQALLEGELAAAQEVQEVLLPEQIETVPGFKVETAYQPAQQVGGDFFQVLPAHGGGLLLAIGDVAGKGLPAAMLVSVLVGAIRATADHTHSPEEMLLSLNERLMGRAKGGFSTALAAHIAADGHVSMANAGHLSPYLDGREVPMPGALPLGIQANVRYETSELYLAPGSRLTFYSDGVVEARNEQGELFGFERSKAISTQSAEAIAEAARQFGQSDDITVVTIEREDAAATAA